MPGAAGLPNKKDVARALLLKGTVFVHLDPRVDAVVVPQWLKRQPQLVLQVGLDLPIPIPDLRLDDVGVFGTLSFNRTAFTCMVPWGAVFAVVGDDGRGMVWPGSMPSEIAAEVEREVHRARGTSREDGAIDEVQPGGKRARQAVQRHERAKPAVAAAAARAKPSEPAPPSLELISGDKERAHGRAGRPRDRRPLPSYLRVVK